MESLCSAIRQLLAEKDRVNVAIDGPCGAGKTALAAALAEEFDCNVLHMDEFFLRPEQRTEQRLAEPGGNVDYERFYEEVLQPLMGGKPFSYRPYNCKTASLAEAVSVSPKKLNIIEGSYSLHPQFKDPYDLKIFLDVSPQLQKKRIEQRPAMLQKRFFEEWIPMENRYFEAFHIRNSCDLLLVADGLQQVK